MSNSSKIIIAVDGGGSKTKAIVALVGEPSVGLFGDASKTFTADIIGEGIAGPGNPRAVGFEVAQENISKAIEEAARSTQHYMGPASAVCLSLAGVGRDEDKARMEAWAQSKSLASTVLVTTDAEPLLAVLSSHLMDGINRDDLQRQGDSASEGKLLVGKQLSFSVGEQGTGIALISGTGTYCFGRNASGVRADSGGWGGLLGDEGGGYWIAMEGLRAVTRHADGRGEFTLLTEAAMDFFKLKAPSGLIGLIYDSQTTRDQVAKFSGAVFELAQKDAIAMGIVNLAAESLAELIATVAKKLGVQEAYKLGLTGGNLCNQPLLRDLTISNLARRGQAEFEVIEIREPSLGGVPLAMSKMSSR